MNDNQRIRRLAYRILADQRGALAALTTEQVLNIGRDALLDPELDTREGYEAVDLATVSPHKANLATSRLPNGLHAPVLDLDYRAHLVPSSTSGHYHLYLDKPIPWESYTKVLAALAGAELIELGYYNASLSRGYSSVRMPGVHRARPRNSRAPF